MPTKKTTRKKARKTSAKVAKRKQTPIEKKLARLSCGWKVEFSDDELDTLSMIMGLKPRELVDSAPGICASENRKYGDAPCDLLEGHEGFCHHPRETEGEEKPTVSKSVTAKPLPEVKEIKEILEADKKRRESKWTGASKAESEWAEARKRLDESPGRLFESRYSEIIRDAVVNHPKLFQTPHADELRETIAREKQEEVAAQQQAEFLSARTGRKYDPELYEQRTLESLKRSQWTIAAIERGSTIVVDPVEDLVGLLKTLEECGIVDVARSNVSESGYTLTIDVTTATKSADANEEVDPAPRLEESSKPANEVGTGFPLTEVTPAS